MKLKDECINCCVSDVSYKLIAGGVSSKYSDIQPKGCIGGKPQGVIDKNKNVHSTQKPIELMEVLIENSTTEKDKVLDPFMGSGTTGIACKNLKRKFIGIELDKKYFKIAKKRIKNA